MKFFSFTTVIVALLVSTSACQSNQPTQQPSETQSGAHKVIVQEVLQTSNYTYLRVKEGDSEQWLAVSKMEIPVGGTYYYENGLPMTDFESKELKRTFKKVLFLDNISSTPVIAKKESSPPSPNDNTSPNSSMPMSDSKTISTNDGTSGVHKVTVKEILQTPSYTYLRVKEDNSEQWLAVSKMQASVGETYYYENPLPMTNFVSKELKRTFKIVLFLSNISSTPDMVEEPLSDSPHQASASSSGSNSNTTNAKQDVKITPAKGGITIATLFKDKQFYSGKTVRIKGKVTKYLAGIMNKNWIHLQDGTDNSGKFDLIATTNAEVKVGDLIILEGAITLNKDFGSGYFYEVIMEDAKIIK